MIRFLNKIHLIEEGKIDQQSYSDLTKRFAVFYRLLIVALVVVGFLFALMSIRKENKEVESRLISQSKILNNIMKNEVGQIEYQITYASSKISLIGNSPRRINDLLSSLSLNSNRNMALAWNSYSWIDKYDRISIDGNIGIVKKPPSVSSRDYLRFTKYTKDKTFIGRPIYGALSKRHIIPIAIGTFSNYDRYLGTLVFGLDVDKVRDKLISEINNKNVGFLVFGDDRLLFHSQNIENSIIQNISNKVRILALDDDDIEEKLTNQGLIIGGDYISVFKKNKKSSIGIAIIYNSECYQDKIIKIIMEKMLVVALLALLFFILFKILYLRIIRPVSDLSEYLKQITKRNFDIKLHKSGYKELSEIYDSLELIKHLFAKEESAKKQMIDINKKLSDENVSKDQFFQVMCQDLRSPIFAISNEIKSLEESVKNKKDQELIENINENIQDMLLLTEDLLDVSRNSTGSLNVDKTSLTDIGKIVDKSIKICTNFAKKNSVTIKNSAKDEKFKKIKLDKKRIRQILTSLLIRMVLSSKKGGLIKVSMESFVSEGAEKFRILIKSDFDCSSLEGSDPFNSDLRNINAIINAMDGKIQIEKRASEWCLVKITFCP